MIPANAHVNLQKAEDQIPVQMLVQTRVEIHTRHVVNQLMRFQDSAIIHLQHKIIVIVRLKMLFAGLMAEDCIKLIAYPVFRIG